MSRTVVETRGSTNVSVSKAVSDIHTAEQNRLQEKYQPVEIAIEAFKKQNSVKMVENGFNYDEASNPGYKATFGKDTNPFKSDSILGLGHLFDTDIKSIFGKIVNNPNKTSDISKWRPTYTLADLKKLTLKDLLEGVEKAAGTIAKLTDRNEVVNSDLLYSPSQTAAKDSSFDKYVIDILQRINTAYSDRKIPDKLRKNYLEHSAKLVILELYALLTHPFTAGSYNDHATIANQLGKSTIQEALKPVKTAYIESFAQDRNRQYAIRVWEAQKKVVDAQTPKSPTRPESAKGTGTIGRASSAKPSAKTTSAPAAAPQATKEAPKMVFALQFPAEKPFEACKGTVLNAAGQKLLEEAVLAPWQLTSATSFDRNLAKLKLAKEDSGQPTKVATIKLDGATGEGKTHLINLLKEAYQNSINIVSIDLNSSDAAIKQLESINSSSDKVPVVIFDELYFYNEKFLSLIGKQNLTDSAKIEKEKAAYIRSLQAKGILVCVSGATENPLIYKLAAERIKDKLADAYKEYAAEEDRLFSEQIKQLGKPTAELTEGDLGKIAITETDELKKQKQYIDAQEDKLKRKISTAERMEKKRETIRNKLSSEDTTHQKSSNLDQYHQISADKLKPSKSTLYVLPDIDAKKFSAQDCKTVAGKQDCVVITPFFLNEGKANQALRYKIWTKKEGVFSAQEVQDEDIGKAFALNSTLPRVIIYDKTTAVGGDLGGLALGVEDIILQYKSEGKSFDDAVQNAGRDRTPKEKDTNGNEILTAKFHIISDKGSKQELLDSLKTTQETQDKERIEAYLGGKANPKTSSYLDQASAQSKLYEQEKALAKAQYELSPAERFQKKIDDAKEEEARKKAAFEQKKSELLAQLAGLEKSIAEIEKSDGSIGDIFNRASNLSGEFQQHIESLGKVSFDSDAADLKRQATNTKATLERVVESSNAENKDNKTRISFAKETREKIENLKTQINQADIKNQKLLDIDDLSQLIQENLEQSQFLVKDSNEKIAAAQTQLDASKTKLTEISRKIAEDSKRKEAEEQKKAEEKAALAQLREEVLNLQKSLLGDIAAEQQKLIGLKTEVTNSMLGLDSKILGLTQDLLKLKGVNQDKIQEINPDKKFDNSKEVGAISSLLEKLKKYNEDLSSSTIPDTLEALQESKRKFTENKSNVTNDISSIQKIIDDFEKTKLTKNDRIIFLQTRLENAIKLQKAETDAKQQEKEIRDRIEEEEQKKQSNIQKRTETAENFYNYQISLLENLDGENSSADNTIAEFNKKLEDSKKVVAELEALARSNQSLLTDQVNTEITRSIQEDIQNIKLLIEGHKDIVVFGTNLQSNKQSLINDLKSEKANALLKVHSGQFEDLLSKEKKAQHFIKSISEKIASLDNFINDGKTTGQEEVNTSLNTLEPELAGTDQELEDASAIATFKANHKRFKLEIERVKAEEQARKKVDLAAKARDANALKAETELEGLKTQITLLGRENENKKTELSKELDLALTKINVLTEINNDLQKKKQELSRLLDNSEKETDEAETGNAIQKTIEALQQQQQVIRASLSSIAKFEDSQISSAVLAKSKLAELNSVKKEIEGVSVEIANLQKGIEESEKTILENNESTLEGIASAKKQNTKTELESAKLKQEHAKKLMEAELAAKNARLNALQQEKNAQLAQLKTKLEEEAFNQAILKAKQELDKSAEILDGISLFSAENPRTEDIELDIGSNEKDLNEKSTKLRKSYEDLSSQLEKLNQEETKSFADAQKFASEVTALLRDIKIHHENFEKYNKESDHEFNATRLNKALEIASRRVNGGKNVVTNEGNSLPTNQTTYKPSQSGSGAAIIANGVNDDTTTQSKVTDSTSNQTTSVTTNQNSPTKAELSTSATKTTENISDKTSNANGSSNSASIANSAQSLTTGTQPLSRPQSAATKKAQQTLTKAMFKASEALFSIKDPKAKEIERDFIAWSTGKGRATSDAGLLVGGANTVFVNFAKACNKINLYTQHLQNSGQSQNLRETLLSYIWDKSDNDEKRNKTSLNLNNQNTSILQKDVILSDTEKAAFLTMAMAVINPDISAEDLKTKYNSIAKDQQDNGYLRSKSRKGDNNLDNLIKSSLEAFANEETLGVKRIGDWITAVETRQTEINAILKEKGMDTTKPGTTISNRPSSNKIKEKFEAHPLNDHLKSLGSAIKLHP